MPKRFPLGVLSLTLLLLLAVPSGATTPPTKLLKPVGRDVFTLVPEGMPVALDYAVLVPSADRAVLSYSVTNVSKKEVAAIEVLAVVYGPEGQALWGNGWTEQVDLVAARGKNIAVPLRADVPDGSKVVVAVVRVGGTKARWESRGPAVIKAMRRMAIGEPGEKPETLYIQVAPKREALSHTGRHQFINATFQIGPEDPQNPPASCDNNFCGNALQNAKGTCTGGVASFSCSQSSCSYSFTCK